MTTNGFLALGPNPTATAHILATAAAARGMAVERLPAGPVPAELRGRGGAHFTGGPRYAARARLRTVLGLTLLEPAADWLDGLPRAFTRRRVTTTTLAEARTREGAFFAKPPAAKSFPSRVYSSGAAMASALPGPLPSTEPVQVSEPVRWSIEFRLYILDGEVLTGSQYAVHTVPSGEPLEGHRREAEVREFAKRLMHESARTLPSAVVLDVGLLIRPELESPTWAVVEANLPWFSSIYAADPSRALDVVLRSAGPSDRASVRDKRFAM